MVVESECLASRLSLAVLYLSSGVVLAARWEWEFWEASGGWGGEVGDQMVKFCFLIRIRKTFEGVGFCLVDCSRSSLFSGRAESPVKQAGLLGPAFNDALTLRFARLSPDSECLLKFCALGSLLTYSTPGPAPWLHSVVVVVL